MMLRLRPYHIKDAETILSWAKDEKAFYKVSGIRRRMGLLGVRDTAIIRKSDIKNRKINLNLWK